MRTYIQNTILMLSTVSLITVGCSEEDLTIENPNAVTVSGVLSDRESIDNVVIGMYDAYQKLPPGEFLFTEMRSDNATSGSSEGNFGQIDNFNLTQDFGEGRFYWSNNYSVIHQANLIIGSGNAKQTALGEAYFMRAICHFNLVRNFGSIPYINKTVTPEGIGEFPQLEVQQTYDNIIADLNLAIENLTGINPKRNRAGEGTAKAFLAKVLLSFPEAPKYAEALVLLNELTADSNPYGYTLLDNYAEVFSVDNELNDEIILAISYDPGQALVTSDSSDDQRQRDGDSEGYSLLMTVAGRSRGLNLASADFFSFVTANAGTPAEFANKEPQRFPVIFNPETLPPSQASAAGTKIENGKFIPDNGGLSGRDWIVMRYADVLLMKVEAIMGDNESTSNPEALAAFNAVRVRAGVAPDNSQITKDELLDERRVELSYENHRFYDLVRFGRAVPILTAFSSANGASFSPTDILLPIPGSEISASKDFYKQNPGY